MRTGRAATMRVLAGVTVLGLVGSACSGGGSHEMPPRARLTAALQPTGSCDELLGWFQDEATKRADPYGIGRSSIIVEDAAGSDRVTSTKPSAGAPTAASNAMPETLDASATNVQVEGVDEPDVVKTDGRRILVFANGELRLVDAATSTPVQLDVTRIDGVYDGELLLAGDRALVIGRSNELEVGENGGAGVAISGVTAPRPRTVIVQVDLTGDRLRIVDTVRLDGEFISGRLIDGVARLVVRSSPHLSFVGPDLADLPEYADSSEYPGAQRREREWRAAQAAATEANRRVIEQSGIDAWLPSWYHAGDEPQRFVDCADVYRPTRFSGFDVLSVLTLGLNEELVDDLQPGRSTAVAAGGEQVYASAEHLFVATTEYSEPGTDGGAEWDVRSLTTSIHRFDIASADRAQYEASGEVEGRLLNQFAMDEHDGVLRVATTIEGPWDREVVNDGPAAAERRTESRVVTLRADGNELREVGRVGGLGRGEQIYSVRFMGDTGYVVTFRRTDPLYTLDLSDPAAPRVVGELKINGYSAYLHPIGDGYLLGVGQDATDEGQVKGTQVALFDVRDPANPTRLATATVPGGRSVIDDVFDHHAFLWWAPRDLAVIPVTTYGGSGTFSGVVGYTVDTAAGTVAERGRVAHPQPTDTGGSAPACDGLGVAEDCAIGIAPPYWSQPAITRSLVVSDRLFTLSDAGLLESDLGTLAPGPFLAFGG